MKLHTGWYSERLQQGIGVTRWGHYGTPLLLFPTAGGDSQEVERFDLVGAVWPLIEAGRVKVYSCDSLAGRAWLRGDGSSAYRSWLQNQFHAFIYHGLVPAIRADCKSPAIGVISAGASIGAFNALAMLCRYPDVFTKAICMSGTYDIEPWLNGPFSLDFYYSSPLHFLPNLNGSQLEVLRHRFVVLASGEGRWENIGQSWRAAHILGSRGIPNRLDSWGSGWDHDWPTWRAMLPRYVAELL